MKLASGLRLPLEAVTHTFGIFGQKGSGKSSTAATFVEQGVAAGGHFVIGDPTGVWWGLMHDGVGPGLPGIVFGGEHGDLPLEPTAGRVVAEFVVHQSEYPVVVLDMKLMRKAERTRFMLDFLETLYHENREALHVVLDEAHQFAPTQAREGGEQIKLLGAVEDVVALGRSRGLGITMISQRFATLNANVREQIGTLVVHQLVGSLDRKALKGWIDANGDPELEAQALAMMAKLGVGRALVWSPSFIDFFGVVDVNAPTTFDSRATPKVGQRRKRPGKRAPVDLATLRERMAETFEKQKANDPAVLKKRIAELERDLAKRPTETVEKTVEVTLPPVEVPVLTAAERRAVEQIAERLAKLHEQLERQMKPLTEALARAGRIQQEFAESAARAMRVAAKPREPEPDSRKREAERPPAAAVTSNGGVPGPQQRILDALGWYDALGVPTPTKVQVAMIAGYSHTSGGYANLLGKLRTAELIDYPSPGQVALTAQGQQLATDPGLPTSNDGVQAEVMRRLPPSQARLLELLISRYPDAMTRDELAEAAGYSATSGGYANLLGKLRSGALIDYPSRGEVVALPVLFPMTR